MATEDSFDSPGLPTTVALLLAAAMTFMARSGHAETCASRISAKAEPKARAVAGQAKVAFDSDRFADALRLYERAFCLRPDPALKHQISASELKLGRCQEAVNDARFWLAHAVKADQNSPETWLDEVMGHCVEITLRTTPAPANLWLDDATVSVGHSPWHGWVTPGEHMVTTQADGFPDTRQSIKVPAKSRGLLKLTLDLKHASLVARPPDSAATSGESDDASAPSTPPALSLAARHDSSELPAQALHPQEKSPPMSVWRQVGIASTAVGAAGLIAATVLAVTAQSATKAGQTQAATSSVQGRVDAINGRITGANVLFGVGGALAAAGVTLTVLFP